MSYMRPCRGMLVRSPGGAALVVLGWNKGYLLTLVDFGYGVNGLTFPIHQSDLWAYDAIAESGELV